MKISMIPIENSAKVMFSRESFRNDNIRLVQHLTVRLTHGRRRIVIQYILFVRLSVYILFRCLFLPYSVWSLFFLTLSPRLSLISPVVSPLCPHAFRSYLICLSRVSLSPSPLFTPYLCLSLPYLSPLSPPCLSRVSLPYPHLVSPVSRSPIPTLSLPCLAPLSPPCLSRVSLPYPHLVSPVSRSPIPTLSLPCLAPLSPPCLSRVSLPYPHLVSPVSRSPIPTLSLPCLAPLSPPCLSRVSLPYPHLVSPVSRSPFFTEQSLIHVPSDFPSSAIKIDVLVTFDLPQTNTQTNKLILFI